MRALLAVVIVSILSGAANCEDAPPSIRQFDTATIEKLGREMYRLDQEAWKATDILEAAHRRDELVAQKMHGWIVVSRPDGDVVRFVHEGENGPELFYDVTFSKAGAPMLSIPADRTLGGEERAMYDARTLALETGGLGCSKSYNTVVLKDPERDGWLVWVMAATTDPNAIVIGGHVRFTISSDGKKVVQKDALSRSCLILQKGAVPAGSQESGAFVSQLVSLTPVETHVFASLAYHTNLFVGTLDGKTWKVDGDQISEVQPDSPGAEGFVARTQAAHDEICRSILSKPIDGTTKFLIGSEVKVIEGTEHSDKFAVAAPEGATVVGVSCGRLDVVPEPNDYKVLLAGYDLFLIDKGEGHPKRSGKLELKDGKVSFQITSGDPATPELQRRIDARLVQLQASIRPAH